ncbi:DUF3253 domain-containing protein [Corynebacterium stercoris]|nr:DUF3253 domain-containing protein [Corynebacterium stercoris]
MTEAEAGKIRTSIREMIEARKPESSICPSEVARALFSADAWRDRMDDVRAVAAEMAAEGLVRITQGDAEVDIATVKGPIRIRRGPMWFCPEGELD